MDIRNLFDHRKVMVMGFHPFYSAVDIPILKRMAEKNGAVSVTINEFSFDNLPDIILMPNMYKDMGKMLEDENIADYVKNKVNLLENVITESRKQNKRILMVYVQNDMQTITSVPKIFTPETDKVLTKHPVIISMLEDSEIVPHIDPDAFKSAFITESDWLKYSIYDIPFNDKVKFADKKYDFAYIGSTRGNVRDKQILTLVNALLKNNLKVFIGGPIAASLLNLDESLKDNKNFAYIADKISVDKIYDYYALAKTTFIPEEKGYGTFITKRFYEQASQSFVLVPESWLQNDIVVRYNNHVQGQAVYYDDNYLIAQILEVVSDEKAYDQYLEDAKTFYEVEKMLY